MRLGLVVTSRCNAQCAHCSTSCGPHRREALDEGAILRLMNEAAALAPEEPPVFSITGGEPFLDFARLLRIVAHGARLGGRVTCMTNASWASSEDRALSTVAAVQAAGLAVLGVSTSRCHQRYVRCERVQRALRVARNRGLRTVLKVAVTRSDRAGLEEWARTAGADVVEIFPVLPYLARGERWPEDEFVRVPGLPEGPCPAAHVTIQENGDAYMCCHPGGEAEFLRLGSALRDSLSVLTDRFHLQGRQQILRLHGPIHLAREVQARGLGDRLRDSYGSICDLCAHIAGDPAMAAAADGAAAAYEIEQVRQVLCNPVAGSASSRRARDGARVQRQEEDH